MADYTVHAATTAVFGRVLVNARHHHVVVDGPVANGCPGEAITPVEAFLGAVVACAVERVQVAARDTDTPLDEVSATIEGTIDRAQELRDDITIFSSVALRITMRGDGLTDARAGELVAMFQARCPLYGTVRAATPDVTVTFEISEH
jgi:uncharacterized OsmC-like protein